MAFPQHNSIPIPRLACLLRELIPTYKYRILNGVPSAIMVITMKMRHETSCIQPKIVKD